jgi:cyclophilin family peptidyl-prolyl cis-trans isomerase
MSAERLETRITPAAFLGGARVALGDINADGTFDIITGAGYGGGPHVRVFNGRDNTELLSFMAFDPSSSGGIYVAAGDVDGDGRHDIVVGSGTDHGGLVRAFNSSGTQIVNLTAFPGFNGQVTVAVGDVNGDGRGDIIAGTGAAPGRVNVFSGAAGNALLASFQAYSSGSGSGAYVAAADLDGDGRAEIITGPGIGGPPDVKIFSGTGQLLNSFRPYEGKFKGGVTVAASRIGGVVTVVTGTSWNGHAMFKSYSSRDNFVPRVGIAYDQSFVTGGVYVGAGDVNGDGISDVVTGPTVFGPALIQAFSGNDLSALKRFTAYGDGAIPPATVSPNPNPNPDPGPGPDPGPTPSNDVVGPTIAITEPQQNQVFNDNPTIKGNAIDAKSGLQTVQFSDDLPDGGNPPFRNLRVDANGNFELTTRYLVDGTDDGPHTIIFRAIDNAGNTSDIEFTFTLDTFPITVGLDPASDTGTQGDNRTEDDTVTLVGNTIPFANIDIVGTGLTTTSDDNGDFTFADVPLTLGVNEFTVHAQSTGFGDERSIKVVIVRNSPPTIAADPADLTVPMNSGDTLINLPTVFSDLDVNSRVQFSTNRGTFDIELFDQQVGPTVNNFLNYVTSGRYSDSIFHRTTYTASSGIDVLQGGGFKFVESPASLISIPTDAQIALQTGLTNARGTVAMARTGELNSATSQFFLNTANNTNLDTTGGGYAVFGAVRDNGMAVIDTAHATPPQNKGGVFAEIPLINYSGTNFPSDTVRANYEIVNGVTVANRPDTRNGDALTFTATSSNTNLVTVTVNGGKLTLQYATGQTGTSTITLTATDANGQVASTNFLVTVG